MTKKYMHPTLGNLTSAEIYSAGISEEQKLDLQVLPVWHVKYVTNQVNTLYCISMIN